MYLVAVIAIHLLQEHIITYTVISPFVMISNNLTTVDSILIEQLSNELNITIIIFSCLFVFIFLLYLMIINNQKNYLLHMEMNRSLMNNYVQQRIVEYEEYPPVFSDEDDDDNQ